VRCEALERSKEFMELSKIALLTSILIWFLLILPTVIIITTLVLAGAIETPKRTGDE